MNLVKEKTIFYVKFLYPDDEVPSQLMLGGEQIAFLPSTVANLEGNHFNPVTGLFSLAP